MSDNQAADYEETPEEQQVRWTVEFAAARKELEPWQKKGDEIDAEFRVETPNQGDFDARLPLFTSDTQTIIAMLYGQVPKATAQRRFGDSSNDVARVGGVLIERIINTDISRDSDTYAVALGCAMMDFFLPGFANVRLRYVTGEITKEEVAAELGPDGTERVEAYTKESRPKEDVEVDYVHWKDWLWGPAKVVHMVPWWSIKNQMTRRALVERFGDIGKLVPLKKQADGSEDPWSRADVHEIHCKDSRKVYWFVEGFSKILDSKDDPLQLAGFWPFPAPLAANLTNSKVVPRPYYALHADAYRQINVLMSRIRELADAVRVTGAYDGANEEVAKMLTPEARGKMIPVKRWALLGESGGIAGAVDWFPVEQVVSAIAVLQGQLASEIDLLHQSTGFSDIMRGEATQAGATATEQRVKARTGSVRVQRLQDEIARFATDILKIKAEIVCKHFSAETIMERANVRFLPEEDQALVPQAIELLRSEFALYQIEVKPEAVALADFAAMKSERMEVLTTLTAYAAAIQPLAAQFPDGLEGFLEIGQWAVAGVRGSSQIEGVFDRMIQQAKAAAELRKQNPQQQPEDPKVAAEKLKQQTVQMKSAADMQKEQFKLQADLAKGQAEVQNDAQREENQRQSNVAEFTQRTLVSNALKPPAPPKPNGGIPR